MSNERFIVRVPKERVTPGPKGTYWVDLGEKDEFVQQVLLAAVNPGQMVVRKGEE